jgi:hypothetical protein
MSTTPTSDRLCPLAETQLQIQASRSGVLDTSAFGVMAVDAALAAIFLDTGATHAVSVSALALLALSLALAVGALRLAGAERTGPSVANMLEAPDTLDHGKLERAVLTDLAADLATNEHTLARKATFLDRALTCLVLALVIELTGRV